MKAMILTTRQAEIASLVARGWTTKHIARETGLSPRTVKEHIREAAERIPGSGAPRYKLVFFVLTQSEDAPA